MNLPFPRRGEVWLVDFDPTVGSEIQKTRPAVIIQNNVDNRFSALTIVAAISSHNPSKIYPTEVIVPSGEGGLLKTSVVLLNQVRTVDKRRLVQHLGHLSADIMEDIDQALLISLGMVDA